MDDDINEGGVFDDDDRSVAVEGRDGDVIATAVKGEYEKVKMAEQTAVPNLLKNLSSALSSSLSLVTTHSTISILMAGQQPVHTVYRLFWAKHIRHVV